ncbi:hypothetical protein L9F63_023244, partial [Diploptera punctata]
FFSIFCTHDLSMYLRDLDLVALNLIHFLFHQQYFEKSLCNSANIAFTLREEVVATHWILSLVPLIIVVVISKFRKEQFDANHWKPVAFFKLIFFTTIVKEHVVFRSFYELIL